MDIEQKIKELRKFLSSPKNKLIWFKDMGRVKAQTYFDFEVSNVPKNEYLTKSIQVESTDEAFQILRSVTINADNETIRIGLDERIKKANDHLGESFFMIFKGNS